MDLTPVPRTAQQERQKPLPAMLAGRGRQLLDWMIQGCVECQK